MAVTLVADEADVLIRNKERCLRHVRSETSMVVDEVMATVTPPEQLTWARTLCWSLAQIGSDGMPKIGIRTSLEQIREFYEERRRDAILAEVRPQITDVRTRWYVFHESQAIPMRNVTTGRLHDVETAALFLMDGSEGISSEIVWLRCAEVPINASQRTDRWQAYLAALRAQDVAGVLRLMAPSVQGAVRDYFDADPPFVALDGEAEMRAYYEKLFAYATVLDLTVVTSLVKEWFVFHDLRWHVRLDRGAEQGREVRFRTAEYMPFDAEGRFQARCGYGTEFDTVSDEHD